MKVQIKRTGTYSKFGLPHGKVGAQTLVAGDVVELPDYYAAELIDKDMIEGYMEPAKETVAEEVVTKETPPPTTKRRPRRKSASPQADTKRHIPKATAKKPVGIAKKG